jgi:hypothetical protein
MARVDIGTLRCGFKRRPGCKLVGPNTASRPAVSDIAKVRLIPGKPHDDARHPTERDDYVFVTQTREIPGRSPGARLCGQPQRQEGLRSIFHPDRRVKQTRPRVASERFRNAPGPRIWPTGDRVVTADCQRVGFANTAAGYTHPTLGDAGVTRDASGKFTANRAKRAELRAERDAAQRAEHLAELRHRLENSNARRD